MKRAEEDKVMFKVGDRVRCINTECSIWVDTDFLVIGETYLVKSIKVINDHVTRLIIMSDRFEWEQDVDTTCFEPFPDTIKISKWEELDGKENGKYKIAIYETERLMGISSINSTYMGEVSFKNAPKEAIITWLALFGFNVQFIPEHTLTEREYGCCLMYEGGWVARDNNGDTWWFENNPTKCTLIYTSHNKARQVPSDLFPWISFDTGPVAIEDLKKLKRLGVD